jgi:two-component system, NarL family, invasion response regulator UvrY
LNKIVKIIIADDHALFRRGVISVLNDEFNSVEISEVVDAALLLSECRKEKYDVIICDINMPGRSGIDIIEELLLIDKNARILILSLYKPELYALKAIKAGAYGYLSKGSVIDELPNAIKTLLQNKKYIQNEVAELLTINNKAATTNELFTLLTNRETEIFRLLASGKTIGDIATLLNLSPSTVSTHRAKILGKLNLENNAQLTHYAFEKNLL